MLINELEFDSKNGDNKGKAVEFDKNSSPLINLTGLSSDTKYTLRLVYFEANKLHNLNESPTLDFKTKKCIPISTSHKETNLKH
jgi:hypothetical protein